MRVLLISTYELGHQPLHVASPAAALRRAGHDVRCLDLSVDDWDPDVVAWAHAIAVSVPMHTAMRLAVRAAERIRQTRPGTPVCFYGLYAPVGREATLGALADRLIAGEYETELVAWVGDATSAPVSLVDLGHDDLQVPARDLLPGIGRYARLSIAGEERPVGYVETSHGCAHRCLHCPVPTVYDGRIRLVPHEVVLDDVAGLVAGGARHITFGDPDFLNGWRHSLRIVRDVHERFPGLTFDVTTKVEHVLRHRSLWGELAAAGCLFVVSAFECLNDTILGYLDKGHTAADAARATHLLRDHGIEVRPSWMPFTPWTSLDDVAEIIEFVVAHDLVGNVDPVQYSIRLLLPDGSLLLGLPEICPYLRGYDAAALTHRWVPADPRTDVLQARLAALVERDAADGASTGATFMRIREAVAEARGVLAERIEVGSVEGRPRLTEPWFC